VHSTNPHPAHQLRDARPPPPHLPHPMIVLPTICPRTPGIGHADPDRAGLNEKRPPTAFMQVRGRSYTVWRVEDSNLGSFATDLQSDNREPRSRGDVLLGSVVAGRLPGVAVWTCTSYVFGTRGRSRPVRLSPAVAGQIRRSVSTSWASRSCLSWLPQGQIFQWSGPLARMGVSTLALSTPRWCAGLAEVVMMGDRRLVAYIAVQAVAGAGSFALPVSAGQAVRLSVGAAGLVVLVVAVVVRRPTRRVGWWLLALSGALSLAAAVAVAVADKLRHAGLLERVPQFVLVILALFALAAGLVVLGWRTVGSRGWDALDATMTALGAFLIVWVLYSDPLLSRSASAFASFVMIAVLAASLLVLVMAVKLAFGGASFTWSGRMVLLASAAALCASAVVYFEPIGSTAVPITVPVVAAWLANAILLGGAGAAGDFVDVTRGHRRPAPDLPRWRLALFVVLALLAPLDVAFDVARAAPSGPGVDLLVPPICATLILLLLVTRLALIARVATARAEEVVRATAGQDELQRTLAYRALHDPLTGVANRYVLTDRMEQLSGKPGRGQALMMLDLDGFKDINDRLGHPVGDQVLVDVARRLTDAVPKQAVLVRLGGDEFGVLLEDTPGDEARRVAEATVEALRGPFLVAGREVFFSASVGLVVTEVGAAPPGASEGLRDADQALYAAKAAGRNRVAEFNPRLLDERLHEAWMTAELRHAAARKELMLHYQPVIRLEDGEVIGVEALARWRLGDGTMVAPSQFIPLAEQAGLITGIGTWVLRQACHEAGPWYAEHGILVGVNVSGRQLDDPAFANIVFEILAETGLPGSALILELTESSLIETTADPTVHAQLDRLREEGVRVAIDDFGTGYSSLSYLTRLPVDAVKIDSSFTSSPVGATIVHPSWAIVRAILELASSLKLSVVAEGIETREQADALRRLTCGYGQGYYFSPPVPADRIRELLGRRPDRSYALDGGRADENRSAGA
jgi:diguanylate cyclase (GGDEF)-like protein